MQYNQLPQYCAHCKGPVSKFVRCTGRALAERACRPPAARHGIVADAVSAATAVNAVCIVASGALKPSPRCWDPRPSRSCGFGLPPRPTSAARCFIRLFFLLDLCRASSSSSIPSIFTAFPRSTLSFLLLGASHPLLLLDCRHHERLSLRTSPWRAFGAPHADSHRPRGGLSPPRGCGSSGGDGGRGGGGGGRARPPPRSARCRRRPAPVGVGAPRRHLPVAGGAACGHDTLAAATTAAGGGGVGGGGGELVGGRRRGRGRPRSAAGGGAGGGHGRCGGRGSRGGGGGGRRDGGPAHPGADAAATRKGGGAVLPPVMVGIAGVPGSGKSR